jgi:hypothetical protein
LSLEEASFKMMSQAEVTLHAIYSLQLPWATRAEPILVALSAAWQARLDVKENKIREAAAREAGLLNHAEKHIAATGTDDHEFESQRWQ